MNEESHVKKVKCFLCEQETAHPNDLKFPIPPELYDPTDNPEQVPYCTRCYQLKGTLDANFMILLREAKIMEWYKSGSRKKSVYYLSRWVFNVDLDKLRDLYFRLLMTCIEADKKSNDKEWRQLNEEQFNYEWRKRDA